jgi:hypothetical protein
VNPGQPGAVVQFTLPAADRGLNGQ